MAPIDLYDVSVPIFLRTFTQLKLLLSKAEQASPTIDPTTARLAPDMHPLTFQIQACSNTAKGTLVRLGGSSNVPMDDNEKTLAELQDRIDRTVELLQKAKREDYQGKEDAEIKWKPGQTEYVFSGTDYVRNFAIPNFMFHAMAVYAILRKEGVDVGKRDWLGPQQEA